MAAGARMAVFEYRFQLPVLFICWLAKYWSTDDFNVLKNDLFLLLKVTLCIMMRKMFFVSTLTTNKMLLPGEPFIVSGGKYV
jgi:hypothetical protein